jgi:hypothetical protein
MANEDNTQINGYFYQTSGAEGDGGLVVGRSTTLDWDGAARFLNIVVPQGSTVNFARVDLYASAVGTASPGDLRIIAYGIDEDNTAAFSTNPFGRTKTTASTSVNDINPSIGGYRSITVTNQVNEIVQRAGWSSGNAMGFLFMNNSSATQSLIEDTASGNTRLIIRVSAASSFTPTPIDITAPTFPGATDFGIKVSQPGVDVKTATEDHVYFTSRKKITKVAIEDDAVLSTGVNDVAHGLSYTPSVLGYLKSGNNRYKLNKEPRNLTDPSGFIGSDATNIKISVWSGTSVYYYVLANPLS